MRKILFLCLVLIITVVGCGKNDVSNDSMEQVADSPADNALETGASAVDEPADVQDSDVTSTLGDIDSLDADLDFSDLDSLDADLDFEI